MTGASTIVTAGRENGRRTRPRGYAAWRPQKATRLLLEQVNTVLEKYENHLPLTVRQVFYSLVATFGYEKTELAYARLAEHLVRARRARLIPFEVIRDDGVTTIASDWFQGPAGFWSDMGRRIHAYRRDRQLGQRARVELWCEAGGMVPQLARVAHEFSVPVFSTGGFSSLSAVRQIVDRARRRDHATVLLHVGDLDPSGESIFHSMAADATAFLEQDRIIGTQTLTAVRVALTPEQVIEFGLPTAPAKVSDSRSARWAGATCQLEALAPDTLATIVADAILAYLDEAELARQVELEHQDIAELWRGLPPAE